MKRCPQHRAVQLDPTLAEGHSALGYSLALYDWKWDEAEKEFKRALELEDKNSLAHVRFAVTYYMATGQGDKAIEETERAVELEPVNLAARSNLTWVYRMAGRNEDALAQGEKLHDLEPDFLLGGYQLGLAYIANGSYTAALELAESLCNPIRITNRCSRSPVTHRRCWAIGIGPTRSSPNLRRLARVSTSYRSLSLRSTPHWATRIRRSLNWKRVTDNATGACRRTLRWTQ